MSIAEYLQGSVNFEVDESAVNSILTRRGVDGMLEYDDGVADGIRIELLRADLLKWIVLGPGKMTATSDSDNGWSHSGGGYTLSDKDKRLLIAEANAIYKAEGEESSMFGKTTFRMTSNGIMRANIGMDGEPLPRIHRG